MSEKVIIFDTTLRDGEQCPGASMTSSEKMEIAHALARLKVDVIEAGFPIASPDDLAAVKRIAKEVGVSRNGAYAPDHLRAGALREEGYRRSLGSGPGGGPSADSRFYRRFADPYEIQAAHGTGRRRRAGAGDGRVCA